MVKLTGHGGCRLAPPPIFRLFVCLTAGQVKAAVHARWSHVLVDESQDTNLCQFELVRALTSPSSSLFMVGDPDQVRVK
jgi:superfamily I DNA/RNA helicase